MCDPDKARGMLGSFDCYEGIFFPITDRPNRTAYYPSQDPT